MKMKLNIVGLLTVAVLATPTVFTSCSEDVMDNINDNVNNPKDVQAKFILTDVITRTAFSNVGGDFNTYLSTYVEHEVGTDNQLWNAEHRESEPERSSTFNNTWGNVYITLKDARMIIEKCSVGGSQEGNYATLGMGQIMAAYNLALLTDMFGDVPYSEGFRPLEIRNPKMDKQEELYKQINAYLDGAIENLPKGDTHASGSVGTQDLLFKGNTDRWLKFAHGLKARYTMRLLKVTSDKTAALEAIITSVDKSFASANEEAKFAQYSASNLNPLFDFQWSRDGLAASQSIGDKMLDRNDPRLNRNFFTPQSSAGVWTQVNDIAASNDSYNLLAPNGKNTQVKYHYLTSTFVFAQTAPTQLLSYHELLFLKAEAMQRLGKGSSEVATVLEAAVSAGIKNSENSVKAAFVAPTVLANGTMKETSAAITDADIASYFADHVKPLFAANALKEIANQKYLAFFGASGESTEMYNDIRRWKSNGEELIELKNPGKFPLRLPYGNDDTTTNPNVEAAYGDGKYVYTEQVWWAGGTR
ncbi:SusD-like starch-binding protein associating with outer membrane [Sphingobacterium yanglingense]|uniref:SusD-like starch-binding protein associating with outer membrane n=2 Tax=Sphingobacterium yanglingense TaxID=1437280 RepID=A0A4V3DD88_9SPHI|nr:SusD-like starch-binding protein associating with outer membrane [Sphingobacterium yanglingense]